MYGGIVGDGEQLARDHHRCKQQRKERFLALELKAGKCKRCEDGDDQGQERRHQTDVHRVQEQPAEARCGERIHVVAQHDDARPEGRRGHAVFIQRFQGRNDHPVEGEKNDQRHEREEEICAGEGEDLHDLLSGGKPVHVLLVHDVACFCFHMAPLNNARASC